LKLDLRKYSIVHVATHGLLDGTNPELSSLVLSLVDEQGIPQDGFLRLHDIYNLDLPAELVVLSSCQSALGKEVKGEGLLSLTRGFMHAGARRLVVSLWEVNDAGASELMSHFYRRMLKEGRRPPAALSEAQAEMWREGRWRHPYYWAGFVLQGEYR
jgi:CHAT domain-containing protein